ncbi:hypothetical protein PCASD_24478 [Puccinia coronata f. sp. avenae]|uniref:Uncharacterized protein n=1 Tax=Puccinia coronata f. sp. avenae TaxID=200324 RepID=A0A2N5RWR9_9BASI|nr:hypothetical protein PCASD_25708 [Puccinia coronata f. sp. avenae]PLW26507.1 hypothetical protein PCASD_24478 [Puccinia coronata f. sp. avenae]
MNFAAATSNKRRIDSDESDTLSERFQPQPTMNPDHEQFTTLQGQLTELQTVLRQQAEIISGLTAAARDHQQHQQFPPHQATPPKGLYRLQPPAARSVAATDVTSVYQTDVTSAAPTDTLCLCSNVSVGPADIKSVWATDVTSVASGRRYRGGL